MKNSTETALESLEDEFDKLATSGLLDKESADRIEVLLTKIRHDIETQYIARPEVGEIGFSGDVLSLDDDFRLRGKEFTLLAIMPDTVLVDGMSGLEAFSHDYLRRAADENELEILSE